jgi:hypothetical protein
MYNVGIIGCGKRFREVYLNVINKLQKNKKIKIQKINSFNSDIRDIRKKLNCEIETNIDLIIKDKKINLIFILVPINLRKKILLNKNLKNKFIFCEVPFSNHLGDYFYYKKILDEKKNTFEVFEDRFFQKNYRNNLNKIKAVNNFNKEWMHHSLGAIFQLNKKIKLIKKIKFINDNYYDIYEIYFNNLIFFYKFCKNKKNANRKLGYIEILNKNNKKIILNKNLKNLKENKKFNLKEQALYDSISNFLFKNNRSKLYSEKYLEIERLSITLMKIMKKFNIKFINSSGVKFIYILSKLYGYLLFYKNKIS